MDDLALNNTKQDKAVLFADVSGSTHLYEALGDTRAFAIINDCLEILREMTTSHSGRVVKTIGDEIMAVFPDAACAVQAACEMQMQVSAKPLVDGIRVAIRIGFQFGPVLESASDGDVFGDTVNIAARMAEIAQPHQIITTSATVDMFPPIMRSSTRRLKIPSIKGKSDDIQVREVIWQETAEMTMMVNNTYVPRVDEPTLQVNYHGVEYTVDAAHPSVTIGRDEQADIVIKNRSASRMHAKIELRFDKFVLIDLSSNGSYVTIRGEIEIPLRREEVVLRKNGTISLGHPYDNNPSEIVFFYNKIV